jgi:histidine triad (HIT) family protein
MEKTIFEKIIDREIPAQIVYEDASVIAFLDAHPVNHGHTLVIPKTKFVNIFDADESVLGHMVQVAGKIGRALKEVTGCDGINLVMNNESAAGQVVFHAHMHVIPRFEGDGAGHHPPKKEFDSVLAEEIVAALTSKLA